MKKIVAVIVIVALVAVCGITLAACSSPSETPSSELRFVMPDGTPALAAADFFGKVVSLGSYTVTTKIVAATSIQAEIGGEKADMVIAPTNAGAMLINNGAPYKLAAVMVEGSLYVIGKPVHTGTDEYKLFLDDFKGKKIASIGQNNTPDKVFKYIIDNTDGVTYDDSEDTITFADGSVTTIEFVADGAAAIAAMSRDNSPCDFALVGEPAATGFASAAKGGYSARFNIQDAYKEVNGNDINFPQASLFVKSSLLKNSVFTTALFTRLEESQNWVLDNASDANTLLQANGSASVFNAVNVKRCAITVKNTDDEQVQTAIRTYLSLMAPAVNWNTVELF